MPRYKKTPFTLTNQDTVLYGQELKLPGTKEWLGVDRLPENCVSKEAKIVPFYGQYTVCMTVEHKGMPSVADGNNFASIDFETDNFAAIVATDSSSAFFDDYWRCKPSISEKHVAEQGISKTKRIRLELPMPDIRLGSSASKFDKAKQCTADKTSRYAEIEAELRFVNIKQAITRMLENVWNYRL